MIIDKLDLSQIAESGQCFRWKKINDDMYFVTSQDKAACLRVHRKKLEILTGKNNKQYFEEYLDLSTDYASMIRSVDKADQYLNRAAEEAAGIRILNQDLWETILCFMISQNNNIPRIKKTVEALCEKFGTEHRNRIDGKIYRWNEIPSATQLYGKDLSGLGLGYRQSYMEKLAEQVKDKTISLENLKSMDCEGARQELKKITGIGDKVADCICLFGLHHLEAFPVDTWVKKILENHYPKGFPLKRYTGYAGVMQQYMFYYERKISLMPHPESSLQKNQSE